MKNTDKQIGDYFGRVISTLNGLDRKSIGAAAELVLETYENGGTIYIFGNGGSAANASHFCGDLIKGVSYGRERRFKVVCLNDNIPAIMAIANDISYADVFVEQLKNFAKPGDLVIGISGSGNSTNVVKAMEYAKGIGAKTIALCGFDGGKIKGIADICVHANIRDMEVSEDVHLVVMHCIKNVIIDALNSRA